MTSDSRSISLLFVYLSLSGSLVIFFTNLPTFQQYLAAEVGSEDLEDIYKEAHANIRANPKYIPTEKTDLDTWIKESKRTHPKKLTLAVRRERIAAKKSAWAAGKAAAEDSE